MTHEEYQEYLKSEHWQKTRAEQLDKYSHKCAICGKGSILDVHHLWYDSIGNETNQCLIVLCRDCHEKLHKIEPTKIVKNIVAEREEDVVRAYIESVYPIIESIRDSVAEKAASIYIKMGGLDKNKNKPHSISAILCALGCRGDKAAEHLFSEYELKQAGTRTESIHQKTMKALKNRSKNNGERDS